MSQLLAVHACHLDDLSNSAAARCWRPTRRSAKECQHATAAGHNPSFILIPFLYSTPDACSTPERSQLLHMRSKEHTVKAHCLQAEYGGHQQRHHAQQLVDRLHCIKEAIVTHCTEASASLQWRALFLASEFVRWAAGEPLGRPSAAAPVVAVRIRQLRLG